MYTGQVIDPHHHLWELSRSYPWLQGPVDPERFTGDDSAIRRDYLPDDLRRDFAGLDLVATVHVDAGAGDPQEEARWLQNLSETDGLPTAIVAAADLLDPGAPDLLERLAALPAVRGVRHILNWHPDPHVTYVDRGDLMTDPRWRANFARLAPLGLRFDLQVYPSQLQDAARLAAEHPQTQIVLNHTGMPLSPDPDHVALWTAGIEALAASPGTAVKISGLGMTDHDWTPASLRPFVRGAIEAFGPSRAMFASNFPVDSLYSDLTTLYGAYDELSADLSEHERADLFAGTARRVYDVAPTTPAEETLMRALVLKEFGQMVVEERPDPSPGLGEVLLRIVATGICGSDLHGYTGENGRREPGQVMGHESVATVAAVGPGVQDPAMTPGRVATFNPVLVPEQELEEYAGREQHAPGKKVVGVAADLVASFAQLLVVPARNVVLLPDDMPITYGALIEPFAVALHALRRLGARPAEHLLVIGGGPIGQSTVLAAIAEGIDDVLVSEVDPDRRALCERLGAAVVDPSAGDPAERARALWGGLADRTVDAVGTTATTSSALTSTKPGGSVCLVGMGAQRLDVDAYRISTEERTVVGSFTYSAQDFRDAASWIASGPDAAAHLISREVALDGGPAAFAALAAHDGTPGKVLVRLDS